MKMNRTIAFAVIAILLLSATAAFAAQDNNTAPAAAGGKIPHGKGWDNPAEMLAARQEMLEKQLADGRITQVEADAALAKIEEQLAEWEEFSSLTLEEKKAKLIADFTAKTEELVDDGKITAEEAAKMIAAFTEKVNAWDGTDETCPGFGRIRFDRMGDRPGIGASKRTALADALAKAVTDEVITQEQADALLEYLK